MALTADALETISSMVEQASEGRMVQTMGALFTYLEDKQLMWRQRVSPRFVHCHPANRDGYGLNAMDCHSLLRDISACGWNWAQIDAMACEVPGSGPSHDSVLEFNVAQQLGSGGLLPTVEPHTIKLASLSCSHTNMALRLILAEMAHECDSLCLNGRLNLERVRQHDAQLYEASQSGLQWRVISADVMQAVPKLASLVQEAMNAGGQLQRREHELQLARRILNTWREVSAGRTDPVAFAEIRDRVLRSKPPCAPCLPHMYGFLMKWGGGPSGSAMVETESVIKQFGSSTERSLGPDFWDAIGASGPADCKRMCSANLLQPVLHAEGIMQEMRALASTAVNKEAIMQEHGVVLTKKWESHRVTGDEVSTAASSSGQSAGPAPLGCRRMRHYDASGKPAHPDELLLEYGFKVGDWACRKADKVVAVITAAKPDGSIIISINDGLINGSARVSIKSFAAGEWVKHTPKARPQELANHWEHGCLNHPDFQAAVFRGKVMLELDWLIREHKEVPKSLKVVLKPSKAVVSICAFQEGQLVLVPATTRVEVKEGSRGHSAANIPLGKRPDGEKLLWSLAPVTSVPKDSKQGLLDTFWFVQATNDAEAANMAISPDLDGKELATPPGNVTIPLMKNTVSITPGTTLTVFRPKSEKLVELAEILPEAPPKKRKVGKQNGDL
ncbi:unnamed protein product [Effrenium voratum]|uniref:Uncharacterized protein n=1 Tax=Effrenium voratum TaxID=2562239 RepID=A0AA36MVS0_9DINO|nr:unnamed protein product [Effrenium voratum]